MSLKSNAQLEAEIRYPIGLGSQTTVYIEKQKRKAFVAGAEWKRGTLPDHEVVEAFSAINNTLESLPAEQRQRVLKACGELYS